MKSQRVLAIVAIVATTLIGGGQLRAIAAGVPQAPGYTKATLKAIVDNDYAAFMGDDSNVTRIFNQNNVDWTTQIANATSLDIYPQTGETYIYLAVMGGGGTEDWGGTLNGLDVVSIPGAQVASGRSPLGTATVSAPYVLLQSFISGYNSSSAAAGTQNVTLANLQTALTGVTWSSAVATGSGAGNVPLYKTTGVCCGSQATGAGLSGKGWNFPSDSLVVFRYPLASLGLPVRAGNAQVVVDWDAPAAGDAPTGYIVQYKKSIDPDSAYVTFSSPTAPTSVETVTGLTNGVSYSFRVAGTNSYGTGTFSAVREAMPVGPPPAPTSLAATAKASSAEISFTDPSSSGGAAITNYEYTLNNGSTWVALSPADTSTPITVPGLTDGQSYSIKLRAVNSYGGGTPSAAVSVTPGLVSRITNLTMSANPEKGISITITISVNVIGKTIFLVNGKRIAGCYKVSTSGSSPNFTATCNWKPAVMGRQIITIQHNPTDSSYTASTLTSYPVQVVKRSNRR
jgi:hypothetical protein